MASSMALLLSTGTGLLGLGFVLWILTPAIVIDRPLVSSNGTLAAPFVCLWSYRSSSKYSLSAYFTTDSDWTFTPPLWELTVITRPDSNIFLPSRVSRGALRSRSPPCSWRGKKTAGEFGSSDIMPLVRIALDYEVWTKISMSTKNPELLRNTNKLVKKFLIYRIGWMRRTVTMTWNIVKISSVESHESVFSNLIASSNRMDFVLLNEITNKLSLTLWYEINKVIHKGGWLDSLEKCNISISWKH